MMNPKEISELASGAQADQMTAHCLSVAGNVGKYHARLLAEGISRKLADNLTLQMADYLWGGGRGCGCEGE